MDHFLYVCITKKCQCFIKSHQIDEYWWNHIHQYNLYAGQFLYEHLALGVLTCLQYVQILLWLYFFKYQCFIVDYFSLPLIYNYCWKNNVYISSFWSGNNDFKNYKLVMLNSVVTRMPFFEQRFKWNICGAIDYP